MFKPYLIVLFLSFFSLNYEVKETGSFFCHLGNCLTVKAGKRETKHLELGPIILGGKLHGIKECILTMEIHLLMSILSPLKCKCRSDLETLVPLLEN